MDWDLSYRRGIMSPSFSFPKTALVVLAALFTGCLLQRETLKDHDPARVTLDLEIEASPLLAKVAEAQLARLTVLFVSSRGDTLRDTITDAGSKRSARLMFLQGSTTKAQVLSPQYDLAPNRAWKVLVKLYDTRDSVRHLDSMKIQGLVPFEKRGVALCLHARYSIYSAHFFLPSVIRLNGEDGLERKIFFTRLRLLDGDNVRCDTNTYEASGAGFIRAEGNALFGSEEAVFFQPGAFGETSSIPLADEYASAGVRTIKLSAYGYLEGDTVGVTEERLLFQGSHNVNAAQALEQKALALDWQPLEDSEAMDPYADQPVKLNVTIGRVGKIVVNVRMSGEVDI
jgi:hypothetical protein